MAYRPARSGSEGNTRLLKSYGGSASPPRQSYPQGYATGGAVKSGNPALAEGMAATSAKAPAMAGKKAAGKGKGTNVNVIVVPGGKPGAAEAPPPPMPMAGPPMPAPGPGPGGPPMPPEGMPMRKSGGRVKKANGGEVYIPAESVDDVVLAPRKSGGRVGKSVGGPAKPLTGMDAGAGGGKGRLEKIKKYGA